MQFSRAAILLTIAIASQIVAGCSAPAGNANSVSTASNNSANSNSAPHDNVDEFVMIVRLPFEPEEVVWKETADGKSLTAVIRFSPENAGKMSAELAKGAQPTPETVTVEPWFPNELIAQGDLGGESQIQGRSFPAQAFLNPPYTKGTIARIESTDYFILHISS